jgi:ABC-type uncharacterized transport system involved in gliding motility auxiliary subunit
MATLTRSGRSARTNAIVGVVSVLGIVVLLNVIGVWVFGRADLTENRRFTLSEVSRAAARDLDGLDVQVFVSKDLPGTIQVGWGQEKDIRGADRELLDKLAEYQSYSNGGMTVTLVADDIEDKAAKAKLELFTGKKAEVSGEGRLEFKKYALGATFQYRNQLEAFALATEPEYFEFEITKILLRLKEKFEKSAGLKDVLDAGKGVADAVKACGDKLDSYRKKDAAGGLGALVGGGDVGQSLRMDRAVWKKECDPVEQRLAALDPFKAKIRDVAQLAVSGRAYVELLNELARQLEGADAKAGTLAALVDRLSQVQGVVDRDHDTLKNSPGRKAIGFLCGAREFCPFADPRPLINPQIAGMLGQKNPLVQQFVGQAKQIEDQINMINEQIRRGVFTRKGLEVKRVDSGEDIPDDVEVLVVYGPERPLAERDLYNIDQFLLSGRSVIFFLSAYDVAVYNVKKGGEGFDMSDMTFDELHREARPTNLPDFLKNYGVDATADLVIEPRSYEPITVIQLQKQGQFTIQSQREFPYPLLPTFTDLDRGHVLVRRLASITMPYVTAVGLTDAARGNPAIEATELVRSSDDSIATHEAVNLAPPQLVRQVAGMKPTGPRPVAVVLKGEFTSSFKGKAAPPRPEEKDADRDGPKPKPADRPFRETGSGRLLVIGSNLGLENISSEKVFEEFNLAQLTSGTADFFTKLKDYVANFQNWQLRLSQVSPIIQDNLDFVFNCLDWGVQKEALVDIRSKGVVKRPLVALSGAAQTGLSLALIVGLPLAFAAFGVLRFASRRKRG